MTTATDPTRHSRVWFVTGSSSGFGRAIVEAALEAGDRVVATARRPDDLRELTQRQPDDVAALALDVTDDEQIDRAVSGALDRFGRIDVVVNNAGHGSVGALEETDDADVRALFDLHVHGPVQLLRVVLPHLRAQRSGHVITMSSFGGFVAYPGFGAYCATKFAIEGWSEALAGEVEPLGIRVTIVRPGAFRTGFGGARMQRSGQIADYESSVGRTRELVDGMDATQPGDPAKAAAAIVAAVHSADPPLRLALGSDAVEGIRTKLEQMGAELRRWEPVSVDMLIDEPAGAAG